MPDFDNYLSPFTWRYGTPAMRRLWSENYKRLLWRKLWISLAETQSEFGLVTTEQVADLRAHSEEIDLLQALAIEKEIQHDLMAEVRLFASQCKIGGKIIHLGATSSDIEDNADALRIRHALELLQKSFVNLLGTLFPLIEKWSETPMMAYTHLQPAEPTTLGYRLALYAQDLCQDYLVLQDLQKSIKGKGFRGAVGTGASFAELVGLHNLPAFQEKLSARLDLAFFPVTSQVYPRKQDLRVVSALADLGASLYKFAFDLRLLQSPLIGELSEPFNDKQVGSSAMPFKRNPISSEKVNSLARYLASLPRLAWDNAAHSLLERTLDDSANRRILLPEAFLAADELLRTMTNTISRLRVDETAMAQNLAIYGPFAATERLLIALVKAGADRQEMHERLRHLSLGAWEAIRAGQANPLLDSIIHDERITEYLEEEEIRLRMDASQHVGDAPQRALEMAQTIRSMIQ